MPTRKQYMEHEVTFRQYYAQYVTVPLKQSVLARFGLKKLTECLSKDEHLNNIPLSEWDIVGKVASTRANHELAKQNGSWISPAYLVCIAKEAAKQLVEEGV